MSILDRIRSGTESGPMNWLLWIVVATFVFWGAGMSGGDRAAVVATVNGERINGIDFARAFEMMERQTAAERSEAMTQDEREALRTRVLQDLVRQQALVQEARAMGLAVSDAEVADALLEFSFLINDDGVFDKRAYQQFLRRQGKTRADFEAELRDQLLVQKLQELMILGATVAEPTIERAWFAENTRLNLAYVRIRPSSFQQSLTLEADELARFREDNASLIEERYQRDLSRRYDRPETIDYTVIRLSAGTEDKGLADLKAEIEAMAEDIRGGADMTMLAIDRSSDPSASDGGLVEGVKVSALDPRDAAALQDLQPGDLSEPVVGDNDVRLFRVEARVPAQTTPLEEVADDIALTLYQEQEGPVRAAAFADQELLPAWVEAGEPPEALIEEAGLRVDKTGLIPAAGGQGALFRPPKEMMAAARRAQAGDVLPEVYEDNGVLWVGQLIERQDPDPQRLEDERDQIREQALIRRRVDFFQGWVDDVVARADIVYLR